ncbi:flagellar assembly protein FliX [uncultured Cohaesibacter sp.]|uniref:flagellar assembly protein FliX n=1 Tax=uncultured Cohaesibacter sp. TaxID=1002546 RepID=UPI0029315F93|nr:flagellar assembly protein FliX [uncultured Cohaesibacter sp.]
MRVQGGNGSNRVGKGGGTKRTQGGSSRFTLPQETEEATQTQQTVQSSAIQDVSALLALQTVDDALQGKRRKAVRKGNKMLDLLEDIRMGLLSGNLPMAVLQQLERLSADPEPSGDERIDALLEEIVLRAQVEIAKLEKNS